MVAQINRSLQESRTENELNRAAIEQHFRDQEATIRLLQKENTEWRTRCYEVEEENERQARLIEELTGDKEAWIARHTEEHTRKASLLEWLGKLMANSTIPAGCKITYIYLYIAFHFMKEQIVNSEMILPLTTIEAGTGQSSSSISTHLNRAIKHDLLERRDEKQTTKEGDPRTIVHLTLRDEILMPDLINLEKNTGGARVKGCKTNGTPMDAYTVRHCPEHGEIEVYKQPGLRAEAKETDMIDAIIRNYRARIPNALAETKKQDAFESQAPAGPDHAEKQDALTASDLSHDLVSKKQDALEIASNQLAAQHTYIKSTASSISAFDEFGAAGNEEPDPCGALIGLNGQGQRAGALEKVVTWHECDATKTRYSSVDGARICASCDTPRR